MQSIYGILFYRSSKLISLGRTTVILSVRLHPCPCSPFSCTRQRTLIRGQISARSNLGPRHLSGSRGGHTDRQTGHPDVDTQTDRLDTQTLTHRQTDWTPRRGHTDRQTGHPDVDTQTDRLDTPTWTHRQTDWTPQRGNSNRFSFTYFLNLFAVTMKLQN